jgi:hypothetical protein
VKLDKPTAPKLPPKVSAVVTQMRESRLLIPIALLVVAIIAAPILLARSSDPAPAPIAGSAAAGSAEAASSELDPVVLTATPGLRDYKERLDPFASKNPFKQQLTDPPKSAEDDGSGDGGDSGTGDDADALADAIAGGTATADGSSDIGSALPDVSGDDGGATPIPGPTPDPDTGGNGGNGGNGGGGGNDNTGDDPEPEPTKITVRYGPAGNTQLLIDLKPVHAMAGPDDPLARLRRVSEGAAVFGISPEVELGGEGTCLNGSPCNLLRLRVDETAELTYRPTGETYRLTLLRVK